ncbi:hypothetical protein D3C81_1493240 [compost metagenome]
MTQDHVSTISTPVDEPMLYLDRNFIGALGDSIQDNPKVVSVMLNLVASIAGKGAVQTTQTMIAQECKITLKEVVEAIAHLSSAGFISSVMLSLESGGPLSCVVRPDLATAEKPEGYD